ncbi:MAG: M17 family peptidase N-terminal domain-containing protein [Smithellaceae bacterium]|nr:M17 family peptidase N-terminal domain-containing protein [Smithellaceae bacterium]
MQITISTIPIDKAQCLNLVLGFFSDERPPQGAGGLIDWRLNGLISRELARGRLSGAFREELILFHPGRLKTEAILFYGLGEAKDITLERLYEAGRGVTSTMIGISRPDFTLTLPGARHGNLDMASMTEALLTGCFEVVASRGEPPGKLPSLAAEPNSLAEAISGFNRFQRNHNIYELRIVD